MGAGGGGSLPVSIIQDISSQALAPQKGQHLFPGLVLRWSCHARPLANPAHSAQVSNSLLTCLLHACSPTGPSGPSEGAQVRGQGVRCYCPLLASFRIFHGLYSSMSSDSATPRTDYSLPSSSVHGILQARILEWVAFPLSQGIFPTQGSNPGLPHCRRILYQLSHQGSPRILEWVAYPFFSGSS